MSTTFYDRETGEEVAHRFSGGATRGVVVELRPGAARVLFETPLRGEDGSSETLETLCEQIGAGRAADWVERLAAGPRPSESLTDHIERSGPAEAARQEREAFELEIAKHVRAHSSASLAGIEDALHRIGEELHLANLAADERSA